MNTASTRFDAPFWIALLACVILTGALSFIGLAAAAQGAARSDIAVVSVGDT